ncbi:TPA: hypothetical protein DEP90_02670 [Patescibacteria group bacterium]|nr:hypothetical protein [Patescibacteria group bacterium]
MEKVKNSTNTSSTKKKVDPLVIKGKEYENTAVNPEDLDNRWLRWKCLKCNFVYEGKEPLNVCPKCGNSDPDLFVDAF